MSFNYKILLLNECNKELIECNYYDQNQEAASP